MKLDKIKFAALVAFIQVKSRNLLEAKDVRDLDELIEIEVPKASPINTEQLHVLMALMQEGMSKIEAIKQHRMMTGYGLKESKDIIDKYWPDTTQKYTKQQMLNKEAQARLMPEEGQIIEKFINSNFEF